MGIVIPVNIEKEDAREEYEMAHRNFDLALRKFARIIWDHDEIIHQLENLHHLDIDLALMELRRRNRQVAETVAVLATFEKPDDDIWW